MSMHEMYSLYCEVPARNSSDLRGNWLDIILLMLDLERGKENWSCEVERSVKEGGSGGVGRGGEGREWSGVRRGGEGKGGEGRREEVQLHNKMLT